MKEHINKFDKNMIDIENRINILLDDFKYNIYLYIDNDKTVKKQSWCDFLLCKKKTNNNKNILKMLNGSIN